MLGGITAAGWAATPAEENALAQRFITAYFQEDKATVRTCVPADCAEMFMAYPFAAPPALSAPKVHKNQAVIEFSAPTRDSKFPTRGGIVLYKYQNNWLVRQVLFYTQIPAIFGLPTHSETGADHAQEARVLPVGKAFLLAWHMHNLGAMQALWFNWPAKEERRVKGLTFSHFQGNPGVTAWGDPYVAFSVKATYHFWPFSYSMTVRGGVILVQTKAGLKVRGNHIVLLF
jgi:hypothetical protein